MPPDDQRAAAIALAPGAAAVRAGAALDGKLSERGVAALCASLVALAPVSMAMLSPALPGLAHDLGVSDARATMTITAYFVGFAGSQLLCGPMSDTYGRKPVGLVLLGVYVFAALCASLAPNVDWLIAARALQGIGAAAGWTLSRAIVRDLYVGRAAARVMNLTTLMLGLAPAISPTLGGIIVGLVGWRGIFVAMLVYGGGLALTLWIQLPETNLRRDPEGITPRLLFAKYRRLLSDPRFLRSGLALGFVISTFYTLAAILPFVMIGKVGFSPAEFGYAMLCQSGALFLGNLLTRRLLVTYEARRLVPFGLGLGMLAAAALVGAVIGFGPSLVTVMGPLAVFSFAVAFMLPGLWTEPVAPFGLIAGAASALLGTIQMTLGVTATAIVQLFADPVTALVSVAAPMPLFAAAIYFSLAARATKAAQIAQGTEATSPSG